MRFLLALLLGTVLLAGGPTVPNTFVVNERALSWTTTFDLEASPAQGKVTKKFWSMADQYEWTAPNGSVVAVGRKQIFSWGNAIDVRGAQGEYVGQIKEQVFKSMWTKTYSCYSILNAQGQQVATSEKLDWFGTDITLWGGRGQRIATVCRPWVNFMGDKWKVEILDPQAVDSRIIVMVGVFKTDADNIRRSEKSKKSKK